MRDYIKFIEELSFNAWPAYKTELYDDWLIRYSDFYTHRTNCVNVIGASSLPVHEKVDYCEMEYKRLHTPSIFKINPLFHQDLELYLESQQYEIEHTTDTYICNLSSIHPNRNMNYEIVVSSSITMEWILALFQLNKTTNPSHLNIVPKMYEAIPRDVLCISIKDGCKTIATGLGIIEREHIGLYAIYVAEQYRNQQLAKTVCSTLLLKAKEQNLHYGYLQVVTDNTIAKKVYESLGFDYLYTYWFRVKHF